MWWWHVEHIVLCHFCLSCGICCSTVNLKCKAQYTPPTPTRRNCFVASRRRRRCVHEFATTNSDGFGDANAQRSRRPWPSSQYCSQWVTTADGCVHTDDTTKLSPTSCEFVYTQPTRRDLTVSSRRRQRCVLDIIRRIVIVVNDSWKREQRCRYCLFYKLTVRPPPQQMSFFINISRSRRCWIRMTIVSRTGCGPCERVYRTPVGNCDKLKRRFIFYRA